MRFASGIILGMTFAMGCLNLSSQTEFSSCRTFLPNSFSLALRSGSLSSSGSVIIGVGCGDVYIGLPGKAFCSGSYSVKHAVLFNRVCSFFSLCGRAFQFSIEKILVYSACLACGYQIV